MYVSERYKEGIISDSNGAMLVKVRCRVEAMDETIYESLKRLAPLLECSRPLYKINTVFKNILDEKPTVEIEKPPAELEYVDSVLIVPEGEYKVNNVIFTDQEIYGENLDGKDREIRILWKDKEGTEHFVPLIYFDDVDAAVNPHGAYKYHSGYKQLIFSQFRPYDTEYIIRRYNYGTK